MHPECRRADLVGYQCACEDISRERLSSCPFPHPLLGLHLFLVFLVFLVFLGLPLLWFMTPSPASIV